MSMDDPELFARIRVSTRIREQLSELDPAEAKSVLDALKTLGHVEGEPMDFPEGEEGATYYGLVPRNPRAPVIIYRRKDDGTEDGDLLVPTLITRDAYRARRDAESSGLLADPLMRLILKAAAEADNQP